MRILGLDENNIVLYERFGTSHYPERGEIISDEGQPGQQMLEDGTFEDVPIEPMPPEPTQPTNVDIAQMISDLQIDLIVSGVIG